MSILEIMMLPFYASKPVGPNEGEKMLGKSHLHNTIEKQTTTVLMITTADSVFSMNTSAAIYTVPSKRGSRLCHMDPF